MSYHELSIEAVGQLLRDGSVSVLDLILSCIERIERLDCKTNSFVQKSFSMAINQAKLADKELRDGCDRGPLHGIPYGLKDIIDVKGVPTTCCSRIMLDHVAGENAALVTSLQDAGAIFIGKLATHEYALGGPSFDLPFPPARNPWDLRRQPGGSSSGSAVAVASGYIPLAFGSDTSGSIRGPSALTGVVGIRPTYGLVSRRGTYPLSFSLDCCGPMTWTVRDNAIALAAIAGFDPLDPASIREANKFRNSGFSVMDMFEKPIENLKIGYIENWHDGCVKLDEEVSENLQFSCQILKDAGATVESIELPDIQVFEACCRVIMSAESYSIHKDIMKQHAGKYGNFTFQRIAAGALVSAADYLAAQRLRLKLANTINAMFTKHGFDALICGNNTEIAPIFANPDTEISPPTVVKTMPFAVSGHPALAVPCGLSKNKLPIGLQIVGAYFNEPLIYRIGAYIEDAVGLREIRPDIIHAL